MINFRFHIASLVAVFLALALGIVIGSTVIDRAIVDNLNKRLNTIRAESNKTDRENQNLQGLNDRSQDYIDQIKGFAVAGRLDGVEVVPLAVRGIDEDNVQQTAELAQAAGANVPGVLWLEPKLALDDAATVDELGTILGRPGLSRRATREATWQALATRFAGPGVSTTPRTDAELIPSLVDAGFLQFQAIGDTPSDFALSTFPAARARVLLADGPTAELTFAGTVEPLVRALNADAVPLVVGEVFAEQDGGPERGASVAPIRSDDQLKASVSTVDDLDLVEGRVAAVLALADLGDDVVGHYGYGTGASAPMPAAPAPATS